MDRDKLGGMFDKYLLLSPNIFVDPQYEMLIEYVQKTTGQKKEDFCFEEFDPGSHSTANGGSKTRTCEKSAQSDC